MVFTCLDAQCVIFPQHLQVKVFVNFRWCKKEIEAQINYWGSVEKVPDLKFLGTYISKDLT